MNKLYMEFALRFKDQHVPASKRERAADKAAEEKEKADEIARVEEERKKVLAKQEEESFKVLTASSYECPKCKAPCTHFRKHGCHYITCTCRNGFCVLCGGTHHGSKGPATEANPDGCPAWCERRPKRGAEGDGGKWNCVCPPCPGCTGYGADSHDSTFSRY